MVCLLAVLLWGSFFGCAEKQAEIEGTKINLSDSGITVDGKDITNDNSQAVYSENDIIYYPEGKDFTYDDDGRLKSESYDGTLAYEYDYSTKGILGRITDHENNTEWNYTYDLAGRLTDISSDNGKKISYGYNDKNQAGSFTVRQNNLVLLDTEYIYDTYGRVSGTNISSMSGSPSQSYTYDTLGRTNKISNEYAENSVVSQNYSYKVNGTNQTGRVHSVSYSKTTESGIQSLVPTLSYDYDANGNITNVYENSVLKIRYHYDGLNRLVREDNSDIDKTVVYNYDRFGNIRSKVEYALTFGELGTAVNTIPYEYNAGQSPDAVTKYGNETVHYDTYGNAVSYRGYTFTWAKARQLATASNSELTMSFKYDFNGIRTKKTVNGVDTEYFYVGDMLVSQKTGNETINFAYTAGGAPYGFTYNGTSYFYLTNIQGDIIGIYDSNGNVVVEYTYDSWGKLISITGSHASTIGVKNPLRYRGYYYDTETSLYYLQSRYYDPEIGRFINMDVYFIAGNDYIQGTNMYAYCYNNPVMYSDPTGFAVDPATKDAINRIFEALGCIFEYGLSLGYTEDEIFASVSDFLSRTKPLYGNAFELAYIMELGVSVMTGDAWWTNIYSDSSMMKDLIAVMKQSFKIDLGIKGAASFAASIFTDMIPEFLNPLNSNIDLISLLGKHAFVEVGGVAISYSGLVLGGTIAATGHPIIGAGVTVVWTLLGNWAWDSATSEM